MVLSRLMQDATGAFAAPIVRAAEGGVRPDEWRAFAAMLFFPSLLILLGTLARVFDFAIPRILRDAATVLAVLGSFSAYVMFRPSGDSMKLFGIVLAVGLVGWLVSPKWSLGPPDARKRTESHRPNLLLWGPVLCAVLYCTFVAGSGIEARIDELQEWVSALFTRG